MATKKAYFGMTLDPEVGEKIREYAEMEDRSLSYYVNRILINEIKKIEAKNKKVTKIANKEPRQTRRIVRPKKEVSK